MITIIQGNLLEAKEKYIVHQTNCCSHYAAGIAAAIFSKFPYSDVYTPRMEPDKAGTILIKGNGLDERYVVNLMGQYYPGESSNEDIDNEKVRQTYFHHALIRLSKVSNLESVAFPAGIGCGLGGGDWKFYLGTLINFEKHVRKDNVKVTIYCLPQFTDKYIPKECQNVQIQNY